MKKVTFGPRPSAPGGNPDQWVAAQPQPAEPMKRLTIDIPVSLHRRVKTACVSENLVMAEVVRKYLEKRFPEPEPTPTPEPAGAPTSTETQKDGSP